MMPRNRSAMALLTNTPSIAPARRTTAPGVTLEAAMATVDPEKIKKDLYWIADDARGGRGTPSPGQTETAKYLQSHLEQFGWAPGGGPNAYFYHYKTWGGGFFKTEGSDQRSLNGTPIKDENVTGLTLSGGGLTHRFAYGTDYYYSALGNKCDCEITGEIVSAGYGLMQDFSSIDANGKWVVCFDNPLVSPEERRARAKEAGARGLIVLPNPLERNKYRDQLIRDRAKLAAEGHMQYPIEGDFDEITLTREGAANFLPLFQDVTGAEEETLLAPGEKAGLTIQDKRVLAAPFGQIEADNVAGFWKGSDPELSKEVILITAHYDHLGTSRGGKIYNGADDNGSGTASLLALAEAISKMNPRRSVMIMWVSGEELGLLGSQAWVKNPYFPEGVKPVLNINMDMVGRNDDDHELFITPSARHREYNGIVKTFEARSKEEGFSELGSADEYYTRSDHYEYRNLGIPVAFITTGMHADYHKTSDDPSKIDYAKMARNIRLVLRVLADLQADSLPK
jgi:hypothetical protein